MADEQNVKITFDADARSMDNTLRNLINALGVLNSQTDKASGVLVELEKVLAKVAGSGRGTATAMGQVQRASKEATGSIISQRYALYDVASTYGILSAAILGVSTYVIKLGADFESAFTNVERTASGTTAEVLGLRDQLVDLSTVIPKSFSDIAGIATLGNQLGIEAEGIAGFTETVSQFSTVTGISTSETAQSFGQIGELLGVTSEQYVNLGSSIALVGRESVATESQITALAKEISATASGAGFGASEVVGLSAALASLRVAPERARGSLDTYFATLNRAVAEGGEALDNFATVVGVSADELDRLVRTGKGEEIFRGFLEGLRDLDNVDTTRALDELKLAQLRVSNTFQRLAQNTEVYDEAQRNAAQGFDEGTELASQFAKTADDLNSQFQILVNNLNALIEELSGGLVPGIAGAVGALAQMVNGLREFASIPAVQFLAGITIAVGTVIGAIIALAGGNALATASTYALITAQQSLAGSGVTTGIMGLIQLMTGVTTATGAATVSTTALSVALRAIPFIAAGAAAFALIGYLIDQVPTAEERVSSLADEFTRLQSEIDAVNVNLTTGETVSNIDEFSKKTQIYVDDIQDIIDAQRELEKYQAAGLDDGSDFAAGEALDKVGQAASRAKGDFEELTQAMLAMRAAGNGVAASAIIDSITSQLKGSAEGAALATRYLRDYRVAVSESIGATAKDIDYGGTGFGRIPPKVNKVTESVKELGGSVRDTAKEVRTLVDYASDLSGVFGRAFDLRFGSTSAMDAVTQSWSELNDEADEYRRRVNELSADRSVQEYFLKVANAYGDTLRAGKIGAKLADINAELAEAQAGASTELEGNSKAAIENRADLSKLVQQYQAYITSLASSGLTQDQLTVKVAAAKAQFVAQAQQLGYSSVEVQKYTSAFDDMVQVINQIPRNITVDVNMDPALQALSEFSARARDYGSQAGAGFSQAYSDAQKKLARGDAILASIAAQKAISQNSSEPATRRILAADRAAYLSALYNSGNYADGGWTGAGSKYQPAGIVHKDEFVMNKKATRSIGVANLYAMQRNAMRGYASGGYVGGSGGGRSGSSSTPIAVFDAGQFNALLTAVRESGTLVVDGQVIAKASSRANQKYADLGVG